jgi:phosphatidylethanolamine-binding protein (PEBP) family uncharacterized protein
MKTTSIKIKSDVLAIVMTLSVLCAAATPVYAVMDIEQTLSDGAQRNTIAFDGFGIITGTFEAQTFFPPGKLADYWGFQYLRDNTPNGNGHNTSFLTNCAYNILYTLSAEQFAMLKTLATSQVEQINLYGYKRFPLMKAFRRQMDGDIPLGSSGLSLDAVKAASSDLYKLDGQICFDRAVLYAGIYRTLSTAQKAHLDAMKAGGFDSWTVSSEMETAVKNLMRGVTQDVSVALMTYASDLFSWYAGSLDADVYFCPERQGTYFGSFYIKDAPAIGHEGYKIDEALTANAGQYFLDQIATTHLDILVTALVDKQRNYLYAGTKNIVQVRTDISTLLRSLITASVPTDEFKAQVLAQVLEKSGTYGELDGEIVYSYTLAFAQVYKSLTDTQKANLTAMRKTILSGIYNGEPFDYSVCTTPYLYSAVIQDVSVLSPYISNTDYLFGVSGAAVLSVIPSTRDVSKDAGTTTFSVSNTGVGTMPWTAAVTSGSSWLSITSGDSGTDTGTIYCRFTANTSTSARTATIGVTTTVTTGSPQDVTVIQAPLTKGDVNGDGVVDLKDAVIALQILSGISPQGTILPATDIDGDGKIGMAEAIYMMQKASGNSFKGSFLLTSDVGVDGGTLPADYTCDGTGSSPSLSWSNAPAGAKEFALMMTTLPGDGTTKWNWVLYSIPGTTTSLTKNSSGVGILGVGSHGPTMAYDPPCSQGPGPKLYTFTLYALSESPQLTGAANQVTGEVLTKAISPITLGSASLNLSYTRP